LQFVDLEWQLSRRDDVTFPVMDMKIFTPNSMYARACTHASGFFSQKICQKCGGTERNSEGRCKVCRNAKSKREREKNPLYYTAYLEQWRKDNPGYLAKYRKENPDSNRTHLHNRRALKRNNGGKLSSDLAKKLFSLQRGMCACGCGQALGNDYHLDHRMPIVLGGANEDWNMQLLTQRCNNQKKSKHPIDFMQSRGFLL
jgi:hypothetical protein